MSEKLTEQIAAAVQQRLGQHAGADLKAVIAQELDAVLKAQQSTDETHSRIVVAANGQNQPGIVAALALAIGEYNGDIRDLSQTIVGGYFTMLFVVDVPGAEHEGARFMQLRHRLKEVGADLGVHVVAMHDDILRSMHAV